MSYLDPVFCRVLFGVDRFVWSTTTPKVSMVLFRVDL